MTWLAVGAGGALGAILRHGINGWILRSNPLPGFPLGIFVVNIAGSATIGVLAGLIASNRIQLSPDARTFLIAGILGGFTTFSTFSLDTLNLIRSDQPLMAFVNVAGQVVLSLALVALGYRITAA